MLNPLAVSPIMPVVKIDKVEHALPIAEALLAGGIAVIEVTLRTQAALKAIEAIAKKLPEIVVGAGTVCHENQIQNCIDSGASFGLSPGVRLQQLILAKEKNWPFIPGVATASEIMLALGEGYQQMKFFPAEANGGVAALKSLRGPFPEVRFCPTGGLNINNIADYYQLDNVVCMGGSWLTPAESVQQHDWHRISELCRDSLGRL